MDPEIKQKLYTMMKSHNLERVAFTHNGFSYEINIITLLQTNCNKKQATISLSIDGKTTTIPFYISHGDDIVSKVEEYMHVVYCIRTETYHPKDSHKASLPTVER